jgi:hypothetical protein
MKKLIYFPVVLFILLLAVSCSKDAAVKPSSSRQDPPATISLVNNSGADYMAEFIGTSKYSFDMPANSRKEISLKADSYKLEVYPATGSYSAHSFEWNGQPAVKSARAEFSDLLISDSSHSDLLIY